MTRDSAQGKSVAGAAEEAPVRRFGKSLLLIVGGGLAALLLAWALGRTGDRGDATQARNAETSRYWIEEVASGLNFPSSMAWLPGGDILITGQDGNLRRVSDGKLEPEPIGGVPESYPGFWNGLRDVVVDPDFEQNRLIYLLVLKGDVQSRRAAVYRARLERNGLQDLQEIFLAKQGHGGTGVGTIATRMILMRDGTLLFALADERHTDAQLLSSQLGKILRINRDGSVPTDNPAVNTPGARPEIWTLGHRVPLGIYQDPKTGEVFEVEAGPRGGDELNLLKAGANYGWSKTSWGFAYGNNGLDAPLQTAPGIEDPVLVWTPSVTPSGITRYYGDVYPDWNGDYLVGHLTAKGITRLRMKGGHVILQERMLSDFNERIRDVKTGPDGYIYVLTDNENGRLLRLQPGGPGPNQLAKVAKKLEGGWRAERIWRDANGEPIDVTPGDPVRGRQLFTERCAACHSVGTDIAGGKIGPDLNKIYGRLLGRQANFDYSHNMAGSPFAWDNINLNKFIANPGAFVDGTTMASPPIGDPEVRRDIVGYLKHQTEAQQ